MNLKRGTGFTLIEVLIVIVIMSVLAATVIPQFSSSTDEARRTSVDFTLHVLRSQVQLYRAHHLDRLPTEINSGTMPQLVGRTNRDGSVNASGAYGPYLLDGFPVNPITGSDEVVVATSSLDGRLQGRGWGYNSATGEFFAGTEASVPISSP